MWMCRMRSIGEGPYPTLIIAPRQRIRRCCMAKHTGGRPKEDRILDAKKVCWDYRGQGQSDWRLPRLSELMLLWMNKVTINSSKGFTSLGESGETYWTGSEGKRRPGLYCQPGWSNKAGA